MRISRGVGVAIALAFFMLASTSRADNVDDAKGHYKHGTAAYALGKYAEAATEYEAAFELAPDPALLFNAAQAHRFAGNKQRALMLYSSYQRLYGDASNVEEVRRRIDELKQAIEADEQAKRSPTATAEPKSSTRPPVDEPHATPPTVTPSSSGQPAPSAAVAAAPARKRSPAKNPWLWVGIGAGVIVVAGVAIGLGIAFGKSDPKATFGNVTY